MTYSILSGPATFWRTADQELDVLVASDSLHMVMMRSTANMRVILRVTEDRFTNVAPGLAGSPIVIINGNYYDVTSAGKRDAFFFNDGAEPSETTPEGRLVNNGRLIGGTIRRQMFHFGKTTDPFVGPPPPIPLRAPLPLPRYFSGFGPAPTRVNGRTVVSTIGGAGPLIIDGLRYGVGNLYRAGAPANAPAAGAPPAAAQNFLTQRNNNTFRSANGLPPASGKTILAACSSRARVLVCVQEDGSAGQRLDHIRDRLFSLGFDHAVFLDGSNSSCIWFGGRWIVRPHEYKDETNTIGVAFSRGTSP